MQPKRIILAVVAAVGIGFGAWNWMNFFRNQAPAVAGEPLQAVRPAATPEVAASPADPAPAAEWPAPAVRPKLQLPVGLGRDPFLTPEEIELIARGEFQREIPPAPEAAPTGEPLPELRLTGAFRNTVTGEFRAVIDGRVFDRGDTLGAERIAEISGSAVVLERRGRTRTIGLGQGAEGPGAQAGQGIRLRQRP